MNEERKLPETKTNDILFFVTVAYNSHDNVFKDEVFDALPGMVAVLPCFESFQAALRAADGREEFVQVIEKQSSRDSAA